MSVDFVIVERIAVVTVITAAFFVFIFRTFSDRPKLRNPEKISSFFDLDQFVLNENLRNVALLQASALSAAIAYGGYNLLSNEGFVRALKQEVERSFVEKLPVESPFKEVFKSLFDATDLFSLVVVLFIATILFFPQIRLITDLVRKATHKAIHFDEIAERLSTEAVSKILNSSVTINEAIKRLEANFGRVPRPEEFQSYESRKYLSYLLLRNACIYAPEEGLATGLWKVLLACEIVSDGPDPRSSFIKLWYLPPAVVFYTIAMLLFYGFVPQLPLYLTTSNEAVWASFQWPLKSSSDFGMELARATLQIALPFWFGLSFLYNNRWRFPAEGFLGAILRVISAQAIFILVVGAIFAVLITVRQEHGAYVASGCSGYSIWSAQGLQDLLFPCLIAPLCTTVWVCLRQWRFSVLASVASSLLLGGFLYGFGDFFYEKIDLPTCGSDLHFIFEAILGFYVSLAAAVTWLIFLRPGQDPFSDSL